MFSCSFFSVIMDITVINSNTNDDEGAPGPLTNNQGAPNQQPRGPAGPLTDNQGAPGP